MGVAAERDLMAEYRKWFDFWLMTDALDAPNSPGVELYVMGSNRWINGDRYPLEGTTYRSLYIGGSPDSGGYGRLEWDRPDVSAAFDTFTYDPGTPTPSFHAALKRGSLDQYRKRIETGSDVLVYESEPVDQPFDIVGPIEVRLFASSSARDTDWTATLYGLTDSGDIRVLGFTFGILRARFRESPTVPTLLKPGTVYPFVIDLGHTAVTVRTGERLRLEIASAAFPEFSRNLNTGGHNELDSLWIQARQRVYRDSTRASHLLLPVIEVE
jgi:putative CocE/NonD family hydrolase